MVELLPEEAPTPRSNDPSHVRGGQRWNGSKRNVTISSGEIQNKLKHFVIDMQWIDELPRILLIRHPGNYHKRLIRSTKHRTGGRQGEGRWVAAKSLLAVTRLERLNEEKEKPKGEHGHQGRGRKGKEPSPLATS
jgi:hypothetical protein